MFFNKDSWPEVNARAKGVAGWYLSSLLEKADAAPSRPFPQKGFVEGYGTQAAECALAWRFTGRPDYLDKAKALLKASALCYEASIKLRKNVDWYSYSRINALCAYDWIFDELSPEERKDVIVPILEHVRMIQPEEGLKIPRANPGSKHTGFYGTKSLLWYAGLAAYGDGICDSLARAQLEEGYHLNREVCAYRNETSGDDGALMTGTISYAFGDYPFAHFNFFYTMRSAAGLEIAGDYPNLALFPQWVWWTWIRDAETPEGIRHSGTGDISHVSNLFSPSHFYEHCTNYIMFYADVDTAATSFTSALRNLSPIKTFNSPFPIYPFLMDENCKVEAIPEEKLESCKLKCRYFETAGQFLMRSAWQSDATYCSFTAGSSFHEHKHYDENNFTIYKYDHLALDTGDRGNSSDYNLRYYFAQSVAHNVILIHKPGEKTPRHWGPISKDPVLNENCGGMVNKIPATVLAYETGDAFTYIASDATECYGDKCSEAVRQFVYVYPDYFIVYDRVCSTSPSYGKDWLLHFQNKPRVKKNLIRADSGDGRLYCEVLLPENKTINLIGGTGQEFLVNGKNCPIDPSVADSFTRQAANNGRGPYTGAWRIELSPAREAASVRFLNVLTATNSRNGTPVKAKYLKEEDKDGVSLHLNGKDMIFWFNRRGPIGGEVTINGVTRPLSRKVQAQSGILL